MGIFSENKRKMDVKRPYLGIFTLNLAGKVSRKSENILQTIYKNLHPIFTSKVDLKPFVTRFYTKIWTFTSNKGVSCYK